MSRHSQQEIERCKRIASKMTIESPVQGSLAAPAGSADTSKCQRCQTPLVRAVEAGLCAHCCDHLLKRVAELEKQNQLLREIIKDHTRQWSEAKQWREIAEALIEYSNPRVTRGVEYTATVQRANALRPPNVELTHSGKTNP